MTEAIPTLRAKGERGSWFATIQGNLPEGINRVIPCVHSIKRVGDRKQCYLDPKAMPLDPKWAHFMAAIQTGRQVIETSDSAPNDMKESTLPRKNYIAIFEIDEFEAGQDYLKFKFTRRLAYLR